MRLQCFDADIMGIAVGSKEHFRSMLLFIERYGILPIMGKTFDFADASLAFIRLCEARHTGKVAISFM